MGVEGRVFDLRFDEDPAVVFDLVRLDLEAALVLFVNHLLQPLDDLVRHHVDMLATLGRSDRVDEGNVLRQGLKTGPNYSDFYFLSLFVLNYFFNTAKSLKEDNCENKIVMATKISQNDPVRRLYFTLQVQSITLCVAFSKG